MFTIYEQMLREHKRLEEKIESLKNQITEFPEGKLICTRNGAYHKWYQSALHSKTYIPKKERWLAEKLAEKRYYTCLLDEAQEEKKAIESYLTNHQRGKSASQKFFESSPEYEKLLGGSLVPTSQELAEWSTATYERNPSHPEQLIYKGMSGNVLRSKSESMIDTLLYINKIPFRYEAPLILGEMTFYPDFTIRHPITGQFYYWEHFGMMDKASYSDKAFSKMQWYTSHGIFPTIQLITTYETKQYPLSAEVVEKTIAYYFL